MKGDAMRRAPVEDAHADFILPKINGRHDGQNNVVQCDGDGGGDLVAFAQPGHGDGKQCLHAQERCESEENSDGGAERDGMGRVGQRHQRHMVRGEPAFKAQQWSRQRGTGAYFRVVHREP